MERVATAERGAMGMRTSSPTVSVAEASMTSPKELLARLHPYFCSRLWLFHPGKEQQISLSGLFFGYCKFGKPAR